LTDLFSDSFSAMINAVISVVIRIRGCEEKVEFAWKGALDFRPLIFYLACHFVEMPGVSPHAMNEDLLIRVDL
jgi:hypothetical protein